MIYLRKGISMFNFNQFYRMFEDQYRGSTDLIKDRLSFYLPFILPLKEVYPQNFAVDLGCGRGEWVEMLADNGFFPTGVDINDEMVSAKKHEGIVFENRDALDFLKSLPGKSQSLITAFHLIEHISFSYLADLLVQVERVLLPGGLLILETPNPENFRVATESFYLDPSHLRPIPLQFISFLVDYIGIKRQKIARLQEPTHILEGRIAVGDLFVNVSPDYGIIAQKKASKKIFDKFSLPFDQSYGISFADLSKALDKQTQEDLLKIEDVFNEKIDKVKIDTKEQVITSSTETKELITTQFGTFSSELQNQIKQTVENSFSNQIPELIERYTEISKKIAHDAKTIESQFQQIQALTGQVVELENQIPELVERYTVTSKKIDNDAKTIESQFQQIQVLTCQVVELENQKRSLQSQIQDSSIDKRALFDELISVYSSKSFRFTRPLRSLARLLRKAGGKQPGMAGPSSKEEIAQFDKNPIDPEITDDIEYFCGILKDLKRDNR
jgi:SAM-dependent methyltransferase